MHSFCRYGDYLEVANENNQQFGVFCGNKTGDVEFVTGHHMDITFFSDNTVQETGFLVFFTEVELGEYIKTEARYVKLHVQVL